MDSGKEIIHKERREKRALDVKIVFVSENSFNVIDTDGNLKYAGSLNPKNCECPSFIHGNPEKYEASHPDFFECKHIIKAQSEQQKKTILDHVKNDFIGC